MTAPMFRRRPKPHPDVARLLGKPLEFLPGTILDYGDDLSVRPDLRDELINLEERLGSLAEATRAGFPRFSDRHQRLSSLLEHYALARGRMVSLRQPLRRVLDDARALAQGGAPPRRFPGTAMLAADERQAVEAQLAAAQELTRQLDQWLRELEGALAGPAPALADPAEHWAARLEPLETSVRALRAQADGLSAQGLYPAGAVKLAELFAAHPGARAAARELGLRCAPCILIFYESLQEAACEHSFDLTALRARLEAHRLRPGTPLPLPNV